MSQFPSGQKLPAKGRKSPMSETMARDIGACLSEALRERYPKNTAKKVALDTGASADSVKNWLKGNAPAAGHLGKLFSKYGPVFTARVLEPCGPWAALLALEADLDLIREHTERIATTVQALKGGSNENTSRDGGELLGTGRENVGEPGSRHLGSVPKAGLVLDGDDGVAPPEGRR